MKRLAWAALALLVVLACSGGLYTAFGNAYPCDFSQPVGARDQACPPGWVCGTFNKCQPYVNEGLPVDPLPTLPDFSGAQSAFPGALTAGLRLVAQDPANPGIFFAGDFDGGFYLVGPQGVTSQPLLGPSAGTVLGMAFINGNLLVRGGAGGAPFVWYGPVSALLTALNEADGGPSAALEVRAGARCCFPIRDGGLFTDVKLAIARSPDREPEKVFPALGQTGPFPFALADGGTESGLTFQDLRLASRQHIDPIPLGGRGFDFDAVAPVAIATDGFYLRERFPPLPDGGPDPDGGRSWRRLNVDELGLDPSTFLDVRHSTDGNVWSISADVVQQKAHVMSTWIAQPQNGAVVLARLWDDCTPCPPDNYLRYASPQSLPTPSVEVLCSSPVSGLSLWRVVGSSVATPAGRCDVQPLTPPIDLYALSQLQTFDSGFGGFVEDHAVGDVVTMGGIHGEIWTGSALSGLVPVYLDRIPLAVGALDGGLIALSEGFFSVQTPDGMKANTFGSATSGQVDPSLGAAAVVRGIDGWFVMETGDISYFRNANLSFGPPLLTAAGAPAGGPVLAEANQSQDALVISAFDSIYLYPINESALSQAPGLQPGLLPQVTPQPNSPIRSMALDQTRSPLAHSDTGPAVLGYALTSTSVYQFSLGGSPQAWSVQPVQVAPGEPVKVWMQSSTSSNGRVGFRDGSISTLPSGLPFVLPLPSADGGPNRALDFETLDNYPVVLAQDGLWEAAPPPDYKSGYTVLSWQPVARSIPGLPGAFDRGVLYSLNQGASSTLYLFGPWGRVFQLSTALNQ